MIILDSSNKIIDVYLNSQDDNQSNIDTSFRFNIEEISSEQTIFVGLTDFVMPNIFYNLQHQSNLDINVIDISINGKSHSIDLSAQNYNITSGINTSKTYKFF